MSQLVIFDLDRTLAKVNVSFAFGKYLYKSKALSFFRMASLVLAYALHKTGILRLQRLHSFAFGLIFFKKRAKTIQEHVERFLTEHQKGLFRPKLLQMLRSALEEQKLVWIQSSSPDILVLPIANLFGVHHFYASHYLVGQDGTFCKVEKVIDGAQKRKILDDFLQKNLLSASQVTAYSDSVLDLPLLEGVGTVVAVHPERRLKKLALRRNWKIWQDE